MSETISILEKALNDTDFKKILAIPNTRIHDFVAKAIRLCHPMEVFVCSDAEEDIEYVRKSAIAHGEETPLANPNHTVHFDGFYDQARDKEHTRYLVPKGETLGDQLAQMDRKKGLDLVRKRLKNSMNNKKLIVRFFCLGPVDSPFSIPCVQLTDSFYVAHSEDLLYRQGYEFFKKLPDDAEIFWMLHSSGKLAHAISVNWDKRGVSIDYKENTVYSVNTQYAGNTIGLKKLALRLAIRKANREGWLAEHMFLMAVHGPNNRKTYLTGAFPSGCGKTSTSMVKGSTIVGDDIAYLRPIDDTVRGVNVEHGIFGIIRSVNKKDDPLIWNILQSDEPVIFTNVLIYNGEPYWLGDGRETPDQGINHSGQWFKGKVDADGNEILPSHKNARYTVSLESLPNKDEALDKPLGVRVGGIIYGGRDSDTWVPVQQSLSWEHGVITMGASLESETTAATLGPSGIRKLQPFSNLDFVSIPLGRYIQNHLDFGTEVHSPPEIFAVNYFLKNEEGEYMNGIQDKRVWLQWMDRRIHGEVDAFRVPTGYLPYYEDLKVLFKKELNKAYSRKEYEEQFTIRIPQLLDKIERVSSTYRESVPDAPDILYNLLNEQKERLLEVKEEYGDYIKPSKLG